jgi:hypothetical protein
VTPAQTRRIGTGCGGRVVPRLLGTTPHDGNPAFVLHLLPVLPSTTCVFGLASATATRPIGPCTRHLFDPLVWAAATANLEGGSSLRLPLPRDPTLRGYQLFAQGFAVDPSSGAFGWSFSNALGVIIGD